MQGFIDIIIKAGATNVSNFQAKKLRKWLNFDPKIMRKLMRIMKLVDNDTNMVYADINKHDAEPYEVWLANELLSMDVDGGTHDKER